MLTIQMQMLKLCCVGDNNKNVNSGLKGQQFINLIRVGFLFLPPLKSSPNDKMLPSFNRGAIYLLNFSHTTLNHYLMIFLGSFAIRGSSVTHVHLPYWFRMTNICPN
jgi:hypothetical protein